MANPKKKRAFHRARDPHLKRERQQYANPVPSREYIMAYLEERKRPVSLPHLLEVFDLTTDDDKEGLRRRLIAMSRDGQLMSNRRGSYALVSQMELIRGRIQAHRDGFGFLIPDDGSDDIFLPAREMRAVFNDDVVLVSLSQGFNRRREGVIAEVLERHTQQLVGRYVEENGVAFVSPDSKQITQDVMIPFNESRNARQGQFVVIAITQQPSKRRQAVGRVIEILGDQLTPGMEVELAIRSYHLPFQWSEAVLAESQRFMDEVGENEIKGREDLRHLPFVTIDGENAKDFDDAVCCQPHEAGGWRLWVAIADVAHYVKCGSALDEEARARGNSVYFPSKVLPMLPESLSNNLCSLKPKVNRLALVCQVDISEVGEVIDYRFLNAVIYSHARLTYDTVAKLLVSGKLSTVPEIDYLYCLYHQLAKQRIKRGSIEFESTETKIEFDDKGKISEIVPVIRNDAHRLIEEMMLIANVCAADFLGKKKMTTLYRVHDTPKPQKLLALRKFLKNFNLRLSGKDKPDPKDYANLLKRINSRKDKHLLQMMLLRSLQQAEYSIDNIGHFGLAFEAYTHFTSPIRRYPDLLVHRAIKHGLAKKPLKAFEHPQKEIMALADHCSMTERRADRATREATDWLKCDFMQDKVGQSFEGHIVEVTSFGVFVELDAIYIQGLLHITNLKNDYYHYSPERHVLRGKHSGHEYALLDPITVLLARVDLENRNIDFVLTESC